MVNDKSKKALSAASSNTLLSLNKETIDELSANQQADIVGGRNTFYYLSSFVGDLTRPETGDPDEGGGDHTWYGGGCTGAMAC